MNSQDPDHPAREHAGKVMRRRNALKTLAGGAVVSVLVLAGCGPGDNPPTPIATSTPSPWASPSPASSADNTH
jgi:hypothetical protein